MAEVNREACLVTVSCPGCGQDCLVLANIAAVYLTRPSMGDTGSLKVEFDPGWCEHDCRKVQKP